MNEVTKPRRTLDRKTTLRIALTVILVAGGVGAVSTLHAMDWTTFGAALAHVAFVPLAIALVVSTLQVYAQLARFVVLVPPQERQPLRELLDATAVGQLLNYATPLRAGDAYKLIRLAPEPGARLTVLLAALVVERVADIAALFGMAAWASFAELAAWARGLARSSGTAVALAAAGIAVVLAFVVLAPRIRAALRSLGSEAWGMLGSARFLRSVGVSFGTWALDAGTLYWSSRSIGGYALSFRDVMQSVFVLNLGIAVPVTVGNLGVFEAALGFALTRHGVRPEDALAIATLEHFVKFSGLGLCVGTLRAWRR